jgi:polyketide synthase PksJ
MSTGGTHHGAVAVIGISGRFPRARSVSEFWRNIRNGVECVTFFTPEELRACGLPGEMLADPAYVPAKGYLESWDLFDASFFGYSRAEAELMDPQIRILHECVWEALEDAGYAPDAMSDSVGLYIGGSSNPYWFCASQQRHGTPAEQYRAVVLNDNQSLSTRLSYKLGLRGPSFTLQTACSSSLVALHAACRALLGRECGMAVAGGVSITFPPKAGYLHQPGMVTSPDGHCRTFDAQAQGTLAGDGCGLVVLKRLEDALTGNDHIYAVVKGSAINNDGRDKVGYTAPSISGQADVIRLAQRAAGVAPESIGYVEAHGTATPLGDPVELEALKQAFDGVREQSCGIGSVKTNLGHLNHAAGIAGFIKTVLALHDDVLPPSLHFKTPNPYFDFENSPFFVVSKLVPWPAKPLRRACVSSFGIGGTNAHAVLEQAPARIFTAVPAEWNLLVLSAKSEAALDRMTTRLKAHLESQPAAGFADVCYTLQVGRSRFPFRRTILCRDHADAVAVLSGTPRDRVATKRVSDAPRTIALLLPGQGAQQSAMGSDLFRSLPQFRRAVEACLELLPARLRAELWPIFDPARRSESSPSDINQTRLAQPALFICEYACVRLLEALGVAPSILLGHSLGELAAACISGVFGIEDALKLVTLRGELMQSLPRGVMVAAALGEEKARTLLDDSVSLAAVNGPARCVFSGSEPAIRALEARLDQEAVSHRRLAVSHAFHSTAVNPILSEFERGVSETHRSQPKIPFLSNLTGRWLTPGEATDPAYWARQLRGTVEFGACLDQVLRTKSLVLLEAGPGNTLSALVHGHPALQPGTAVVDMLPSAREGESERALFLQRLGKVWLHGVDLDWTGLWQNQQRFRVALPAYPFQSERWPSLLSTGEAAVHRSQDKDDDARTRFYLPVWRRAVVLPEAPRQPADGTCWLILASASAGRSVTERLRATGRRATLVMPGAEFRRVGPGEYEIAISDRNSYFRLTAEMEAAGDAPTCVMHAWNLTVRGGDSWEAFRAAQEHGCYSLLFLAQAMAHRRSGSSAAVYVATLNATTAPGTSAIDAAQAPVLAFSRVISQEMPSQPCRNVDFCSEDLLAEGESGLIQRVLDEAERGSAEPCIAVRNGERWKQQFAPVEFPPLTWGQAGFRRRGVCVITGGLGELGMLLGEHLFREAEARLVLIVRTPPESWPAELGRRREQFLRRLREQGAEVLVLSADCSDNEQMRKAMEIAERRFGEIDGVIHAAASTHDALISTPVEALDRSLFEDQFAAKVRGLLVLRDLLRERRAGFVLVMSSLSSVLGGLGLGAYAAANAFTDACVHAWNGHSPMRWISINWDGWQTPALERDAAPARFVLLSESQGLDAASRILAHAGPAQLLVSATDLHSRQERWVESPSRLRQGALEAEPTSSSQRQPPSRSEVEEKLAELWRNFFGVRAVNVEDGFLESGGDSLMAVALASRINETFSVRLRVSDVLEAQTISRLVGCIERARAGAGSPLAVSRAEEREAYPLSFEQESMLSARSNVYDTRFNCSCGFEIQGPLDTQRLQGAFQELIARHKILHTYFDTRLGIQRIERKTGFRLAESICTRQQAEARIAQFVRPFDVATPPLLRAEVVRTTGAHPLLLLDMHHAITDGISIGLMMSELWNHYRGEPLREVPLDYCDYAVWQRRLASAGTYARDERFWLEHLRGCQWTELPSSETAGLPAAHGQCVLDIGDAVASRLAAFCEQRRITVMRLITAALAVAAGEWTGQDDVTFGIRVSRRSESALERMLGPFVEDSACRIRLRSGGSQSLLEAAGEALAAVLDHSRCPYDHVNARIQAQAPTPNGELFTIMLNDLPSTASVSGNADARFFALPRVLASKYHINIRLRHGDRLQVDAKFRSDRYSESVIRSFLERVLAIAKEIVTNSRTRHKGVRQSMAPDNAAERAHA